MIYKSPHRRTYRELQAERHSRDRILRDTRRAVLAAKRAWLEG